MIRLIDILQRFESDFLRAYGTSLLPSQRRALSALSIVEQGFRHRCACNVRLVLKPTICRIRADTDPARIAKPMSRSAG